MDKLFNSRDFGRRLKSYRQKNHLSQMRLAELIDTSTSSVSHLENGTHAPSLETLLKLASALNIGIDDMLCDSLSVAENHLEKDIADLLSDCSLQEKQIIKDIILTTKKTLREHK